MCSHVSLFCLSLAKGVALFTNCNMATRKTNSSSCPARQSFIYLEFFLAQVLSCGADAGATFPFVDRLTRINKSTLPRTEKINIYPPTQGSQRPRSKKRAAGDTFFILFQRARAPTRLDSLYILHASAMG